MHRENHLKITVIMTVLCLFGVGIGVQSELTTTHASNTNAPIKVNDASRPDSFPRYFDINLLLGEAHAKQDRELAVQTAQSSSKVANSASNITHASKVETIADTKVEPSTEPTTSTTPADQAVPPKTAQANSSTQSAAVEKETNKQPATQAAHGFSMSGQTFDIGRFSGNGYVPGDKVYAWTGLSGHYLVEATGVAHSALASLTIGSPITINGHVYHLRHITYNVPNDRDAITVLKELRAQYGSVSLQTCVRIGGSTISPLNFYIAS